MRRVLERCGEIVPARVGAADLASIGMPGKRVAALQAFARACERGAVDFASPWAALEQQLSALPGFGPWTRTYLAIRLGREPDAFPPTDLGLIRAAQVESPAALLELARRWQPYRAYAATYLWAVDPV
jgi:3-methyladenine DNA glycosylase/8-oxoguanine DNA glycosylase